MGDTAETLHVDCERYPIAAPESAGYGALLAACRADMAAEGACVLEGFVDAAGIAKIVEEVAPHLPNAFYKHKTHNVYLIADDESLPADHPRNRKVETTSATLGYDGIPRGALLERIYRWPAVRRFIADLLGFETLYPNCDPLSPLNVLVYRPGTVTGWHFDNASFVVTLMLRPAAAGGDYEYAPFIRSAEAENFEAVGRVLDGDAKRVRILHQSAGALVIFAGAMTLHRVTAVEGADSRLVGVFTYSPQDGYELDPHTRKTFYGKVA